MVIENINTIQTKLVTECVLPTIISDLQWKLRPTLSVHWIVNGDLTVVLSEIKVDCCICG